MKILLLVALLMVAVSAEAGGFDVWDPNDPTAPSSLSPGTSCGSDFCQIWVDENVYIRLRGEAYPKDGRYILRAGIENDEGRIVGWMEVPMRVERPSE